MNVETDKKKSFCITRGKGFHITFKNGWTVSVQFGLGSYGDNYDFPYVEDFKKANIEAGAVGSNSAEVWCFNDKKEYWPEGPLGWQSAEQVAQIIACAMKGDFSELSQEGK